ncbi:hypothetical protein DPMN_167862 [Dreissena polymorpha]|uniref:Uncharacterized protein n=1 Tax=Dreissena polymorpha TaxID=45954 RepID=A0A9D4F1I5_DREPO|nr:hypothetical protein DPMN_167862 [Dreissena polymorpha]
MSKFHEDNKTAPLPGAHVFPLITTISKLVRDIHITNIQTIFELNCRNQRVITHCNDQYGCTALQWRGVYSVGGVEGDGLVVLSNLRVSLDSHVFQANVTIFELIQDIIETNLLTKFHEDWTINVASRVFTRKNAPPLGSHVF